MFTPESQPNRISPPEPLCRLEQQLDLHTQYTTIKRALLQTRLLHILPFTSPTKGIEPVGIVGINGVEYLFPPFKTLQQIIKDEHTFLETKAEQGFTELKIIPTTMAIALLQKRLGGLLKLHYTQIPYGDFHHGGKPQLLQTRYLRQRDDLIPVDDLDTQVPVSIWSDILAGELSGELIYYPTSFDGTNHGGYTKDQLIAKIDNTPSPGYEIFLAPPYDFLPLQGEGQTKGGRKQLENDDKPYNYLKTLNHNPTPTYALEEGMTIEHFMAECILRLFLTNQVSFDYDDKNSVWLIGNFLASGGVPYGVWSRSDRGLGVRGYRQGFHDERWGCPSAVRIFPLE